MTDKAAVSDAWRLTINGSPSIGQTAERSRRTSMADIEAFTAISGDRNPLHYDRALAEASIFGRLIVQGGVTSGLLNALVAEELPGPGTVFLSCEWKFLKAVGVDETIRARVEILTFRTDKPICTMKTTIFNESDEICLDGTATTYTVPLKKP
jgi:acyl dehydratase